ncbi:MAG: TonB-dependent receptor [Pyrinomonadaceae bacterium MAG19_C2-C3]|nr:TonB-dependent receptor [Pyrinomonadaceae bacterium MAG19_C2-C3]
MYKPFTLFATDNLCRVITFVLLPLFASLTTHAQSNTTPTRTLSGVVLSQQRERAPNLQIIARTDAGSEVRSMSDGEGEFSFTAPAGDLTLRVEGENVTPFERRITADERTENMLLRVEYIIPQVHEDVVIRSTVVDPGLEQRNDTVYNNTLFSRDDQVFHTLDAGINAGQHEGGGKSLEIRRFGFNMDHGGLFGGLKVLVDDVQQNQGTQGHGQGYLGQLKSLTPELIQDVSILNGPFSAEYGDFSGLGVVHIRLKESLPDTLTARFQAGSFDTYRGFFAYSPTLAKADAFIAYEGSRTDGPFISPLRYKRDNLTANYTRRINDKQALGFKLNAGRNDFFSSGQIPLDEVAAGRLDRFGFIDPDNGGKVKSATGGVYYRREFSDASVFKVDAYLTRSLFDLYSNFTFFLNDTEFGDEIQQHDSRLQQGANAQYLRPFNLFGQVALLTVGGNLQAFQTNVGLYPTINRNPNRAFITRGSLNACTPNNAGVPGLPDDTFDTNCFLLTSADASVTNAAGFVQQSISFFDSRVRLNGGVRYDYFRFNVTDKIRPQFSGVDSATRLQPKAAIAYTPSLNFPATFYFNYGRGISSQDARGIVRQPEAGETKPPNLATTDFYQLGTSHIFKHLSLTTDLFLIDNSNQQVYIPDDGSIEFARASRAYGFEIKNSVRLTNFLTFNGGITRVTNAFFRDRNAAGERVYVDSAPHTVGNAALTLSNLRGFTGSLRYRHTSNYRLDGEDAGIRASGLDVLDLYVNKRLRRFLDFNLAIDNLTNKRYFETQNFFESRIAPGAEIVERIHATPGYPFTVTAGITLRFAGK